MPRLIDANLNRISEGLRLLEDVVCFLLTDATLSEQLKPLRHDLPRGDLTLKNRNLIMTRDSARDVGAFTPIPNELERGGLPAIVLANGQDGAG